MLLLTLFVPHDSLATLKAIVDGDDKAKAVEANGLLLQINKFKLLFLLIMFTPILSCSKMLSDQLQCKNIDMSKAVQLVSATVETLSKFMVKSVGVRWSSTQIKLQQLPIYLSILPIALNYKKCATMISRQYHSGDNWGKGRHYLL